MKLVSCSQIVLHRSIQAVCKPWEHSNHVNSLSKPYIDLRPVKFEPMTNVFSSEKLPCKAHNFLLTQHLRKERFLLQTESTQPQQSIINQVVRGSARWDLYNRLQSYAFAWLGNQIYVILHVSKEWNGLAVYVWGHPTNKSRFCVGLFGSNKVLGIFFKILV